jgi:hypothetical protein
MSALADIAVHTQRFRDVVRAFTPPPPKRYAKLMPLKEGIHRTATKGASLRLIRELLATVGVVVSTITNARFLAQVSQNSASARQPQRFRSRTHSCSEHDPSVTSSGFAIDRRDSPQYAAAASLPTNDEMLKGIPG